MGVWPYRLVYSFIDCALLKPTRHYTFVAAACAAVVGPTAGLSTEAVTIKIRGVIEPECAVSENGSGGSPSHGLNLQVVDITRPGQRDYSFVVDCNAPFAYRLEARYGALTHDHGSEAPTGFVGSVPYDVTIRIPTDSRTIEDHCAGASLRAGQVSCPFSDSGDGIALGREARLTVAWRPTGIPLAGRYTDRLSVTVGARQ